MDQPARLGHARICAVVVTHNRLPVLRLAVRQLLAEPIDHLVIVDNASDDGTADFLAALADPRVDHLRLEVNTGGAGGFETGLRHAVATYDPDWMLLQDDDAWPEKGTIATFRASATDSYDAIVGAVRLPNGTICEMNRPVLNPFKDIRVFLRTALGGGRGAFHLGNDTYDSTDDIPVDGGSFVGLFLSRRAIAKAGYPDGRLFIYADDTLYCLGLRKSGGRISFMPALRFTHDCKTFVAGNGLQPAWKLYFYHRNLLILYRAAAGIWFWPALLLILPRWARSAIAQGRNRRRHIRLLIWALRDGLRQNTAMSLADLRKAMAQRGL